MFRLETRQQRTNEFVANYIGAWCEVPKKLPRTNYEARMHNHGLATALAQLGANPDPDEVDRIMGGRGPVTKTWCTTCTAQHDDVVIYENDDDYTQKFCRDCVSKMSAQFA